MPNKLRLASLRRLSGWCAALTLAVVGVGAHAHGLRISVQPQVDALAGQVLYADGSPARDERVALFDGAGKTPVATTVTDADGRFRVGAVAGRTYRVVAQGDEGHRAEASVVLAPAATVPGAAGASDPSASAAGLSAAIRAEIAPLRADLARLEQRIRLSDLIGGVGFLVGLFGFMAWFKSRRRS